MYSFLQVTEDGISTVSGNFFIKLEVLNDLTSALQWF